MGISWVDMGWYSGRLATTTAATGSVRFGVWAYFVAKQFDRITTAYRVCFSWLQHRTIRLRLKRYWPMLSRSYLYSWWAHARPQNFNFTFYHIFPSGNQSHGWKIPHLVQWFSQLSTISFEDFPLKAALTDDFPRFSHWRSSMFDYFGWPSTLPMASLPHLRWGMQQPPWPVIWEMLLPT